MDLSSGPWAAPVPCVEGLPPATLISCVMEPPTVSQVDRDTNLLYTRLNLLPESRATEQGLSLLAQRRTKSVTFINSGSFQSEHAMC